MKKLVFLFMTSVAITFASCGGKTNTEQIVNDSDSVATVIDSLVDSVIAK